MGTIIQGYPKSKKNKSEKRNGRYSKKEVIPMEKHEQQKIVNRSIKEFTNKGDLITLDMLFKKDLEKKKKFEEYYAKNKDEVNNLIILGLEDFEIIKWEEFCEKIIDTFNEKKEMDELPEKFWGAEEQELRTEIKEWAEFYENEEDEQTEDVMELEERPFVKIEGDEDDYFVVFKKDTNLEDISELEELIQEKMEKNQA